MNDITVIIPAKNSSEFIDKCIKSISKVKEVIVVDNGSTDNTAEIAGRNKATVISMPNVYVGALRNNGAKLAKTKYVLFLDSDCILSKGWIGRAKSLLNGNDAVCGGYLPNNNASWVAKSLSIKGLRQKVNLNQGALGAMLIKKGFFIRNMLREDLDAGEDLEWFMRVEGKGKIRYSEQLDVVHFGEPETLSQFIKKQYWHGSHLDKLISLHGINRRISTHVFGIVITLSSVLLMLMSGYGILFGIAGLSLFALPIFAGFLLMLFETKSVVKSFQLSLLLAIFFVVRTARFTAGFLDVLT